MVPHSPAVAGYTDLTEIGRGGFSVVYSAIQVGLNRPVALKVLHASGSEAHRFAREAAALGALTDVPHVVLAYAIASTSDGRPVMVMPLMADSLARRLLAGPCSPTDVDRWAYQLAQALAGAHQRGILHRDVKPENVLLTAAGDAYLADFGIAALATMHSSTTTSHSLSPPFAPPERFTGAADPGAPGDVYSLAATLYAALAGVPPFGTEVHGGPLGLMRRVVDDPLPPIAHISPAANEALRRALAKDPAARFTTATEFAEHVRFGLAATPFAPTVQRDVLAGEPVGPTAEGAVTPQPAPTRMGSEHAGSERAHGETVAIRPHPTYGEEPPSDSAATAGIAQRAIWITAAATLAAVAVAATGWWLARSSPADRNRASAPTTVASTSTTVVESLVPPPTDPVAASTDPALYYALGIVDPAREQECTGLFGFCLDQPISNVTDAFGPAEVEGFPRRSYHDDTQTCHGWELTRFPELIVCERSGFVSSFELWVHPDSPVSVAFPPRRVARLPATMADFTAVYDGVLTASGVESQSEEGFDLFYKYFDVLEPSSGAAIAEITLVGRQDWGETTSPFVGDLCDYAGFDAAIANVIPEAIWISNMEEANRHEMRRCGR